MKTSLFTLILCVSSVAFSQPYETVESPSKKCSIIQNAESSYGMLFNKQLIVPTKYSEYESIDGMIVFQSESESVCYNVLGKKVLELKGANMTVAEWPGFIIAWKSGSEEHALYTNEGREIAPFAKQEFEYFENGMLVKRSDGQQAFFDKKGTVVLPFAKQSIYVVDDYNNIIGLQENESVTLLLNEAVDLPSHSTKLNDYTFAKDREVSVKEYLAFLGSQKRDGFLYGEDAEPVDVATLIPDTTKVEAKLLPLYRYVIGELMKEEPMDLSELEIELTSVEVEIIVPFRISKTMLPLLDFPVTGITKQQAKDFCSWMTIVHMENDYSEYENSVFYRLPSEDEWEQMATQALRKENLAKQMPDSLNVEKCMLFVFETKQQCKNYASYIKASKGGGSVSVSSIPLDMSGRSHVYGNVAEMIDKEGVAKGGSFAQPASAAKLTNDIPYSGAQPWLGFRMVGSYKTM